MHGTKWSKTEAVASAGTIAVQTGDQGERAPVVLLGRRAFDAWVTMAMSRPARRPARGELPLRLEDWLPSQAFVVHGAFGVALLPHPSGRSREWNAADAVRRARVAVVRVAPWLRQVIGPPEED